MLRTADVDALTDSRKIAVNRSFLPRFALAQKDQMRALICDGASLLAWVGAYRARPFTREEQRQLGGGGARLRRTPGRAPLERRLGDARRSG